MGTWKNKEAAPSAHCYATHYHRIEVSSVANQRSENGIRDRTLVDLY